MNMRGVLVPTTIPGLAWALTLAVAAFLFAGPGHATAQECEPACEPGWELCDGICRDTQAERLNCGDRGFECEPDQRCEGATCVPCHE